MISVTITWIVMAMVFSLAGTMRAVHARESRIAEMSASMERALERSRDRRAYGFWHPLLALSEVGYYLEAIPATGRHALVKRTASRSRVLTPWIDDLRFDYLDAMGQRPSFPDPRVHGSLQKKMAVLRNCAIF